MLIRTTSLWILSRNRCRPGEVTRRILGKDAGAWGRGEAHCSPVLVPFPLPCPCDLRSPSLPPALPPCLPLWQAQLIDGLQRREAKRQHHIYKLEDQLSTDKIHHLATACPSHPFHRPTNPSLLLYRTRLLRRLSSMECSTRCAYLQLPLSDATGCVCLQLLLFHSAHCACFHLPLFALTSFWNSTSLPSQPFSAHIKHDPCSTLAKPCPRSPLRFLCASSYVFVVGR